MQIKQETVESSFSSLGLSTELECEELRELALLVLVVKRVVGME